MACAEAHCSSPTVDDQWRHIHWQSNDWQRLQQAEADYLAKLNDFDSLNKQTGKYCHRTDKFDRRASGVLEATTGRVRKNREAKALANRAVAVAASAAAEARRRAEDGTDNCEEGCALLLDGADATTAAGLLVAGFRPDRVLVPNIVPEVATTLRSLGLCAWAGRVEEFLRDPILCPLDLVYLDHTGAFPRRSSQIWDIFEHGVVAVGGALAFTFSTREGPWPENTDFTGSGGCVVASTPTRPHGFPDGWSRAHAVYALFATLIAAAASCSYALEGANIEGLDDYRCRSGVVKAEERHNPVTSVGIEEQLRQALAVGNLAELAQILSEWATQVQSARDKSPSSGLGGLACRTAVLTARALPALAGQQTLGEAWAPRKGQGLVGEPVHAGRPLAVLGANGMVQDEDAAGLRNIAAHVLAALSEETGCKTNCTRHASSNNRHCSDDGSPPQHLGKVQAEVKWMTFRRCLLLYPEQMMFAVLRVVPKER